MAVSKKEQPDKAQEDRSILINFVLDKSGSMAHLSEATISGFNEFLLDQQREGGRAFMTLTLFDTRFNTVATAVPIREMLPLDHDSYRPDGMTALYDAIGHTMRITDDYVRDNEPDQVLFVVMTDGAENSSREFSRETIFQMIADRQQMLGYEFIYLGANQDSYLESRRMGFREGRAMDYAATDAEARATMKRVSHNVRAYRRDGEKAMPEASFFSPAFEAAGATEYEEHKRKKQGEARESRAS